MIKKLLLALCLLFGVSHFSYSQNEVVNNEVIISLLKEGFNSDEIIGMIDASSDREITMSITAMRELKTAGASSELIQYLQKIAKTDYGYEGILWWNPSDGGKPVKLHRTSFEHETSGGWGGIAALAGNVTGVIGNNALGHVATIGLLTSGGSMKKVIMQGASAKVVLNGENGKNPVFRFYFPKRETSSFEKSADSWYYNMMNEIESPNEFQCIHMKAKKNKRTFPEGVSYTVMGFTATKATRNIVEFEIKDLSNNVFEVTFKEPLEPGEYCFFYKNGLNNEWFKEHMFGFDFSIQ